MKQSWLWKIFAHSIRELTKVLKLKWEVHKGQFSWFFFHFFIFDMIILSFSLTLSLSVAPALAFVSLSRSLLNDINWQEVYSGNGQPLCKELVIAVIIDQWIQHLSTLKTWITVLENSAHVCTHTHRFASLSLYAWVLPCFRILHSKYNHTHFACDLPKIYFIHDGKWWSGSHVVVLIASLPS